MRLTAAQASSQRHAGPPLWLPAIIYALLFCGGLYALTASARAFPWPWESQAGIAAFFRERASAAMTGGALHFGAAIPLGIYTATVVSRLRFLGIEAAGPNIAMFGGFAAAMTVLLEGSLLWTLSFPGIADNDSLAHALYRIQFALGGPGFSVPFGLLVAGVALSGGLAGLLPKWLFYPGLLIGALGALSWLNLLLPQALFLIPFVRFPGFVWLILVGFVLPTVRRSDAEA